MSNSQSCVLTVITLIAIINPTSKNIKVFATKAIISQKCCKKPETSGEILVLPLLARTNATVTTLTIPDT